MNEELLKKFVAEIEHRYDMTEPNVNSHLESLKSGFDEKLRSSLLVYNFNSFMDEFN